MNINYSNVKRKLETSRCREHGEHPKVTVSGDRLSISCCCDRFKKELSAKAEKMIAEEAGKALENSLKKMFK